MPSEGYARSPVASLASPHPPLACSAVPVVSLLAKVASAHSHIGTLAQAVCYVRCVPQHCLAHSLNLLLVFAQQSFLPMKPTLTTCLNWHVLLIPLTCWTLSFLSSDSLSATVQTTNLLYEYCLFSPMQEHKLQRSLFTDPSHVPRMVPGIKQVLKECCHCVDT